MGISQQKFGKYIRKTRESKGLTRAELAERLFVSEDAVEKWENGKRYPDFEMVKKLADELGVSVQDIYDNSEEKINGKLMGIIATVIAFALLSAAIGLKMSRIGRERTPDDVVAQTTSENDIAETTSKRNIINQSSDLYKIESYVKYITSKLDNSVFAVIPVSKVGYKEMNMFLFFDESMRVGALLAKSENSVRLELREITEEEKKEVAASYYREFLEALLRSNYYISVLDKEDLDSIHEFFYETIDSVDIYYNCTKELVDSIKTKHFEADSQQFYSYFKGRINTDDDDVLVRVAYDNFDFSVVDSIEVVDVENKGIMGSYMYEGKGFNGDGDFAIALNPDNTFTYCEGYLSSHYGMGDYEVLEDELVLHEKLQSRNVVFYFKIEKDALIFEADKSDEFIYVKVPDGGRFNRSPVYDIETEE